MTRRILAYWLVVTFGFTMQISGATICAVTDAMDTDCGDGTCWFQAALDLAQGNTEDDVIRVIRGTHVADNFDGFDYSSSDGDDLRVEGGWDSSCSTQILDPGNTIIDGITEGGRLYLQHHEGGDIYVEGLTVQNSDWWNLHGLHVITKVTSAGQSADITIFKSIIQDNDGKGGLYAEAADYTQDALTTGSIIIEETVIRDNTGDNGLEVITTSNNGTANEIQLLNNQITNNPRNFVQTTTTNGTAKMMTVSDNLVSDNGPNTGGLRLELTPGNGSAESIKVLGNQVLENNANGDGGGLLIVAPASDTAGMTGGAVHVINNIIAKNTAGGHGGGIDLRAANNTEDGDEGLRFVVNNTITDNESSEWTEGHGMVLRERADSVVHVYNNIAWGNGVGLGGNDIRIWGTGTTNVYFNDYTSLYEEGTVNKGDNVDLDPGFGPGTDNFHLGAGSQCIDAGSNSAPEVPSTDIDGEVRPADGDGNGSAIVDMGADEVGGVDPEIFSDGFESGDTTMWSQTVAG